MMVDQGRVSPSCRRSDPARETRQSSAIFRSMNISSFLAVHVGEIERAEAEALEALEYGNQHAQGDRAISNYGGVIYNVRRAQGRGVELLPLLEGLVESQPTLPVWRIALACLADHLGRHDVADGHYRDAIALADRARAVPYGAHYRYEWARALVDRGDTERAKPLLAEVADLATGRDMHGPDGYVAWSATLLERIS